MDSFKPGHSLALTPPMGWNSWNQWGPEVSADKVMASADALVSSGLRDLGYRYLVIDDCWSDRRGRGPDGRLVPDPVRFPRGIKPLADYCHERGLMLGIYSDAAERTCGGWPGSYGHEDLDARTWAEWGIDYLKYDYCGAPPEQDEAIRRYTAMGQALRNSGREILFSLCEWGGRSPWLWGREAGGSLWRVTGDVFDSWVDVWMTSGAGWWGLGIDHSIDAAAETAEYGKPGAWNDLDMLVVGLKGKGQIHGGGLSFLEYQTQMSVWAMACSPLMIGCDLAVADTATLSLLGNKEVLAVNQDTLGIPARRVRKEGACEIWKKPLSDGSVACLVVNRGYSGSTVEVLARDAGLLDAPKSCRDLWKGEDLGDFTWSLKVETLPHQGRLLRFTP